MSDESSTQPTHCPVCKVPLPCHLKRGELGEHGCTCEGCEDDWRRRDAKASQPMVTYAAQPMAAPLPPASNMLEVIARAAADPAVDVGKLERLLAMKMQIDKDERIQAFRAAKARLHKVLPQIDKHGRIVHQDRDTKASRLISKFAKLEDIDVAIRPLLAEEGFAFSFDSTAKGDQIEYSCELSHEAGHAETKTVTLGRDTSGAKNAIQAVGSSTSYARRMLIKMHLNLIERDEDDDGNGRTAAPITKEHAATLAEMLAAAREAGLAGFEDARVLKWVGVSSFDRMLDRDFDRVHDRIRIRVLEAEAAPTPEQRT